MLGLAPTLGATAQVKPGIEVLRDGGFKQLQGKRVGLITNPSGVDNNLKSTIDILHEAPGVKLTGLYSPEHGVRGDVHAGDHVDFYVDQAKMSTCSFMTSRTTAAVHSHSSQQWVWQWTPAPN